LTWFWHSAHFLKSLTRVCFDITGKTNQAHFIAAKNGKTNQIRENIVLEFFVRGLGYAVDEGIVITITERQMNVFIVIEVDDGRLGLYFERFTLVSNKLLALSFENRDYKSVETYSVRT